MTYFREKTDHATQPEPNVVQPEPTVIQPEPEMSLYSCGLDMWNGWSEKDYQSRLYMDTRREREAERQRKIWMDNVREDLKEKNIDLTRIDDATRNREVWRSLVRASSSAP